MIPLAVPNLAGNEGRYLQECVDSTFVSSVGPFVTRFEEMVAASAGTAGAVAVASGTVGLHLALATVGVGRDDLVVVPSLTFVATANAVSHAGATPWLFDVSPDTWTLDPDLLRRVLAEETESRDGVLTHRGTGARIGAVMPVHTLGMPANMDPLSDIAAEYGLPVVADAAAGLGASYHGRPIGALGAKLSVFSFNGNKTVTAGGGGIVAGDDQDVLGLARHHSTTARSSPDYDHDRVGFNYRMTNLQAAVGCAQMEQLDTFVAAKRHVRRRYEQAFAAVPGARRFPALPGVESADWFSGFVLEGDGAGARNAALRRALRDVGIDARPFWKPMHLQAPYALALRTSMDITDDLWSRVVTLPCSTAITAQELDTVVDAVREALAR